MIKPLCLLSSCRCIRPSLFLQHIMTLKWIKWMLLLCFFMALLIRLFTLSYLTAMSYLTRLLYWIRPFMAWSKHLICGIRLYTIFSHFLISVNLISIIACLYKTVSSSLSMLTTFCLLKRISQLFRMLNNVLMTCLRCQISVLCSTI